MGSRTPGGAGSRVCHEPSATLRGRLASELGLEWVLQAESGVGAAPSLSGHRPWPSAQTLEHGSPPILYSGHATGSGSQTDETLGHEQARPAGLGPGPWPQGSYEGKAAVPFGTPTSRPGSAALVDQVSRSGWGHCSGHHSGLVHSTSHILVAPCLLQCPPVRAQGIFTGQQMVRVAVVTDAGRCAGAIGSL